MTKVLTDRRSSSKCHSSPNVVRGFRKKRGLQKKLQTLVISMHHKSSPNAESIIDDLTTTNTPNFARFKKSKIAQRILLLTVFINEKFEQPNRYYGSDRVLFNQFKSLNEEQRTETINTLRYKMDGL